MAIVRIKVNNVRFTMFFGDTKWITEVDWAIILTIQIMLRLKDESEQNIN